MSKSKTSNLTLVLATWSSSLPDSVLNKTEAFPFSDGQQHIARPYSKTEESLFLRFSFTAVVLCTIVGSLLVCAVNIKNKGMLKSPYNVNIFHLAITDLLVAFVVFLTPGFTFLEIPSPPEGKLSGEIFCRIISSHFLTFSTATTSIYITVALATERWYAVARPLQYRAKFHKKRLICEVFIIWGLSLCANALLLFEVKYNPEMDSSKRCEVTKIAFTDCNTFKILGVAQFLVKFLIPFLVTCNLYYRVLKETHKSRVMKCRIGNDMRHSISRMAAVATLVLTICWLPNQVYYAGFAFDLVTLNTPVHYTTIVIAMINSCLNPFIFAFHSVQYRTGFRNLFCGVSEDDKLKRIRGLGKFRFTQFFNASSISAPLSPGLGRSFRANERPHNSVDISPEREM